jgi:hypothetical protein
MGPNDSDLCSLQFFLFLTGGVKASSPFLDCLLLLFNDTCTPLKSGGEILLSRYHKVIQFLPQICTPLSRGIPRNLIFTLLYIGIPINLVYTAAQGYPWKSDLH